MAPVPTLRCGREPASSILVDGPKRPFLGCCVLCPVYAVDTRGSSLVSFINLPASREGSLEALIPGGFPPRTTSSFQTDRRTTDRLLGPDGRTPRNGTRAATGRKTQPVGIVKGQRPIERPCPPPDLTMASNLATRDSVPRDTPGTLPVKLGPQNMQPYAQRGPGTTNSTCTICTNMIGSSRSPPASRFPFPVSSRWAIPFIRRVHPTCDRRV